MPLSDAGKFVWNSGASSYIFEKDFTQILEQRIDTQEDYARAADGTLRLYGSSDSTKHKKSLRLQFEEIGATQRNQFATIWKQGLELDFYLKQTDSQAYGTFRWVKGFNFTYSHWGMTYKNLWRGEIYLEEV
jgi:hypothetical protein